MAKKIDSDAVLSTLQDILIFQMASAGVAQNSIRTAVGLDMNRVNRIAKLAKKPRKNDQANDKQRG